MGTNFYFYRADLPRLHIGKSSAGWTFALHVEGEIQSLEDWKRFLVKEPGEIRDEYGNVWTLGDLLREITERSWPGVREPIGEPGPNGLVRCRVGKGLCVGHGPGTWDLIEGEFY